MNPGIVFIIAESVEKSTLLDVIFFKEIDLLQTVIFKNSIDICIFIRAILDLQKGQNHII